MEREKVKTEHLETVEGKANKTRGLTYENSIRVDQTNEVDKYLMQTG